MSLFNDNVWSYNAQLAFSRIRTFLESFLPLIETRGQAEHRASKHIYARRGWLGIERKPAGGHKKIRITIHLPGYRKDGVRKRRAYPLLSQQDPDYASMFTPKRNGKPGKSLTMCSGFMRTSLYSAAVLVIGSPGKLARHHRVSGKSKPSTIARQGV
jgi:hypothetical protein